MGIGDNMNIKIQAKDLQNQFTTLVIVMSALERCTQAALPQEAFWQQSPATAIAGEK